MTQLMNKYDTQTLWMIDKMLLLDVSPHLMSCFDKTWYFSFMINKKVSNCDKKGLGLVDKLTQLKLLTLEME